VVETSLVVDVATKYSCNCTKNCIVKVWTLKCRLLAWQLFMDGTFSVPPHPFKQLYTIRVPFKDVTGTAVYAFLPNKCQDTYRELFQYPSYHRTL
jgi:hypothetical protein